MSEANIAATLGYVAKSNANPQRGGTTHKADSAVLSGLLQEFAELPRAATRLVALASPCPGLSNLVPMGLFVPTHAMTTDASAIL